MNAPDRPGRSWIGALAAAWGLGGICLLLLYAIARLGQLALELSLASLQWHQWAALVANVGFMAYSEGYRGFQRAFSPRTVARALFLQDNPHPLHVLLAPAFCMGYFHATRRRMISTYALTLMIVGFVAFARGLDQPWRGILDAGVVVGLAWGLGSLLVFAYRGFAGDECAVSPEVPGAVPSGAGEAV